MESIIKRVEEALSQVITPDDRPEGLYAPIAYALEGGGKRLRPSLLIMTAALYGVAPDDPDLMRCATAIEVFHNFTLLHDDLMDRSPIRRGRPTVYKQWNENTAILSGDAMVIKAYAALEGLRPEVREPIFREFNSMALGVCEGQQLDMDFEDRNDVTEEEYMEMIRLKTSCLLASAMKIGALVTGKATDEELDAIYESGTKLGLAFQLQDDYLDVYGDDEFGKRRGGDIIEEKKTWIFIRACRLAQQEETEALRLALSETAEELKIGKVKAFYTEHGLGQELLNKSDQLVEEAVTLLDQPAFDPQAKEAILSLYRRMMRRKM